MIPVNTAHVPSSATVTITTVTQPTGNNNQVKLSATEKRIFMSLLAMNVTYFVMEVPYMVGTALID